MVKRFETLVSLCDEELRHREYLGSYYARILSHWEKLQIWLDKQGIILPTLQWQYARDSEQ